MPIAREHAAYQRSDLRTEEGYMAEFEAEPDGSFLLIENHCPICAAAKT
jgi:predicted ArsR family transcriptional regulator